MQWTYNVTKYTCIWFNNDLYGTYWSGSKNLLWESPANDIFTGDMSGFPNSKGHISSSSAFRFHLSSMLSLPEPVPLTVIFKGLFSLFIFIWKHCRCHIKTNVRLFQTTLIFKNQYRFSWEKALCGAFALLCSYWNLLYV